LQALQDCNLCPPGQLQKLQQMCEACGFDLADGAAAAAAGGDLVDTLQQLLGK
jgi:hypothetical protein